MSKKNARRSRADSICEPLTTYIVSKRGISLAPGTTKADAWRALRDIGQRLACLPIQGETLRQYADRLRARLEPYHRDEYLDGAAIHMLRITVDLFREI